MTKSRDRISREVRKAEIAVGSLLIGWLLMCDVSAAPPAVQLLPSTTKAYAATDDIHRLDADWKRTRIAAIFDDAKMTPFMDELKQRDNTDPDDDALAATVTWDDLLSISAGQASSAVVAIEQNKPASILLVSTPGKDRQVAELMKRLSAAHTQLGAKRTTQTIAGQPVVVYQREVKDGQQTHKMLRAYFLRDDIFGATDNLALLTGVFGRWDGAAGDSLEKLASFQSIRRTANTELPQNQARGIWFLDPFGYEKIVRGSGEPTDNWQRIAKQGFAGIQAIGGSVAFSDGELDVVHHLAVYAPEPLQKAAGMLAFVPAGSAAMPDWIPADVGRFSIVNWDLSAAFAAYGSWFDDVYGEGESGVFEEVVLGIRDDPGSPGVDIRKDLLANLQGPLFIIGGAADLKSAAGDPTLLAIKTSNDSRVRAAVEKLLSEDPDVERRGIGATQAWVFRSVSEQVSEDENVGPDLSNVAVCLHEGYLMVATDVALLENVLTKGPNVGPLATDGRFTRVLRRIDKGSGEDTILRQFSDDGVDLRVLYGQLRAGKIQEVTSLRGRMIAALVSAAAPAAAETRAATNSTAAPRELPLAKLPEFDAVRPYLGTGGMLGRRNDDGWSVLSFTFADPPK